MSQNSKKTIVVKLGGSTLGGQAAPDTTLTDFVRLVEEGWAVVLVHGGGNAISSLLKRLGHEPRFHDGLRVTDEPALDAALMAMRGGINARLVTAINSTGQTGFGLSGLDGRLLEARRDTQHGPIGLVGEIVRVNPSVLQLALDNGMVPVVAPFAVAVEDAEATIFNINADNAAAWIAATLHADECVFLTDVPGVLDHNKTTIPRLNPARIQELMNDGTISGGMIPKMRSALKALESGGRVLIIDGRQPNALYTAVNSPDGTVAGTLFSAD